MPELVDEAFDKLALLGTLSSNGGRFMPLPLTTVLKLGGKSRHFLQAGRAFCCSTGSSRLHSN
ncbi:MAG: hypothetical protein J0H89_06315 [Rhizobiales bacterium]|jgi:hypothetical protein|nr:hypothetical protein [Hyphomicrobiales bacterium]